MGAIKLGRAIVVGAALVVGAILEPAYAATVAQETQALRDDLNAIRTSSSDPGCRASIPSLEETPPSASGVVSAWEFNYIGVAIDKAYKALALERQLERPKFTFLRKHETPHPEHIAYWRAAIEQLRSLCAGPKWQELQLQGLAVSGARQRATINGRAYQAGDILDGTDDVRVERITKDGVVLDWRGERVWLSRTAQPRQLTAEEQDRLLSAP